MAQDTRHPLKQARSFEEQYLRLTRQHGLLVKDPKQAEEIFSTVNYYRLSAYGKQLRRSEDSELYREGTTLEQLYMLYRFDMGLRHAVLPVLEFFEIQLRARISYQLAMTYGSEGYTDPGSFRQDDAFDTAAAHKGLLSRFRTEVKRQADSPMVQHHIQKYGGRFPVWTAVELFSFGMLKDLYILMKYRDRKAVAERCGISPEALEKLIGCAVEIRNTCAHYNQLYNKPIDEPLLIGGAEKCPVTLFELLRALHPVLSCEPVWEDMLETLAMLEIRYHTADLGLCGFPDNWKKHLIPDAD